MTDVRAVVMARVAPPWLGSSGSLDDVTQEQARAGILALLAESQQVIEELTAYQDDLARCAALAGATFEQRGAAVGLGKERARRRWPWPTTK